MHPLGYNNPLVMLKEPPGFLVLTIKCKKREIN